MDCTELSITEEIAVNFGSYLTNQYEILLRTLSFLNIKDLARAALVCRTWNQVVQHLYRQRDKTNKFRWHTRQSEDSYDGIFFRSSAVIGFELPKHKYRLWMDLLTPDFEMSDGSEDDDEVTKFVVPGVSEGVFSVVVDVIIAPTNDKILKHCKSNIQGTALFFPQIDGFCMKHILLHRHSDIRSITEKLLRQNGEPLKGLLIFDRNIEQPNLQQKVFETLVDAVPAQPFAIAGGLFKQITKFNNVEWVSDFEAVLFAFYGQNVDCYADVLQCQVASDVERFFQNTKKNLTPIDISKQQRIAFVFRCIGRPHGKRETDLFFKYFPDTPAFVLLSYGEFVYRTDTSIIKPDKKFKMGKVDISYAFSTVYFFVTVNLPM